MTASTTKPTTKIGAQCYITAENNSRFGDEVIAVAKPKRMATSKLWMVQVRSVVDGGSFLVQDSHLTITASLSWETLAELEVAQGKLRIKLASAAQRAAEELVAQSFADDIDTAEIARCDAAWSAAQPSVVYRREASKYIPSAAKVTAVGPEVSTRRRDGSYYTTQYCATSEVSDGQVSWSSMGLTTPAIARAVARTILLAADVAEGKA